MNRNLKNKMRFKERGFWGYRATYVCRKHKKTSRVGGRCPICRQSMVCIGYRHRIGRDGEFDKRENFTKSKLDRRQASMDEHQQSSLRRLRRENYRKLLDAKRKAG